MQNRVVRLVFVLLMLVLLAVFAFGPASSGLVLRPAEHRGTAVEVWDGLNGLLADPFAGGSSSAT